MQLLGKRDFDFSFSVSCEMAGQVHHLQADKLDGKKRVLCSHFDWKVRERLGKMQSNR